MSETKKTDDIVIDVDDADLDNYVSDGAAPAPAAAPAAEPKKRGRKKKEATPPPTPVEERLDEEAEASWIPVPLTTAEQEELALRDRLEGKGYTAEDFRNSRNYLVEAGAGAGKTYIMIQRIVNQLVSGYCEPKDIVAITFTNKSTLEMQDRLDKFLKQRRDALRKKEQESSLSGEEQARLERVERLIRETGQMQISTIHSFCQTMLESMPFASQLGLDMQVMENDEVYARNFLKRKWWEENPPFEVPRQLGVPAYLLEKVFLDCRWNSEAELGYQDVNSPEAAKWKSDLKDAVCNLQKDLHALTALPQGLRDDIREIAEMDAVDFAADEDAARKLLWECLIAEKHFPLDWGIKEKEEKEAIWQSAEGVAVDGVWLGQWSQQLRSCARYLIHAYTMRDVEELLAEYRAEKIARHIATYDDLLLRTRDMLRESSEARAYFHQRYKVIYVDEMQDTDPVQTEMLFYLTTGEQDFDPTNWKNCKPVPGSLFLVGDPKQAIYRFRGADIGVYNDLLSVFHNGAGAVGEKVTLRFNFRSSTNICALADRAFEPVAGANSQEPYRFVGGKYHAEYVSMNARSGDTPRARTLVYEPSAKGPSDDPRRIAAFIYMMIKNQKYVGIHRPEKDDPTRGKLAHPAQPEDFLILTRGKKEALSYAEHLRALGIAAEVTGEKSFKATKPIARAVLHLESLLALRDDHKLLPVLRACYHLEDEVLRIFMQRTGEHSLTGLLKLQKLEKIQRALEAEATPDADLLAVCAALEELAQLRKMARNLPAMAVIEQLLEGGYGVWQGEEKEALADRRQTWSEVQQYLNLVRGSAERSFPALAAYAVECAAKDIEHELGLEPSGKAVQIMNLHKAKGLEGEVVILACDWKESFPVSRHVERSSGKTTEYRLLNHGYNKSAVMVGCPMDWENKEAAEQEYLAAEYARLMYVAATRAKTMLLVCDKNRKAEDHVKRTSYWAPLTETLGACYADKNDPYYGDAFKMLATVSKKDLPEITPSQAAPVTVDPAALEAALQADAQALTEEKTYPITPSRLEKHARGVVAHKDKDAEDAGGAETDEAAETSAAANDFDPDAIPVAVPSAVEAAEKPEPHKGPYGPVWGTMVHRVMELAVQEKAYTDDALQEKARQAIHEMLTGDEMTPKQRGMLGVAVDAKDEAVVAYLVPAIVEAIGFMKHADSPLRKLIDGASCYPELPFILQAKENDADTGELYKHLSAHIANDKAKDRVLTVEGIIDLAIRKEDGWYIVDYKTDKLGSAESEADYALRLRGEYTPQITAYARVLEKMNGANALPVKGAWLCSIPLGGEFIELHI